MCNRDKANCVIYGVDGTDCHLGSPARSENIIASPAPNELKMWMAEGKGWELASPLMPRVETKSNSEKVSHTLGSGSPSTFNVLLHGVG